MTSLLGTLMGVEAFTFLVGSILHGGISIFGLAEPRIPPVTVVEALCGVALATLPGLAHAVLVQSTVTKAGEFVTSPWTPPSGHLGSSTAFM